MKFKGCIVEESLEDNRILNGIEILRVRITNEEKSSERWHIYDSLLTEEQIDSVHSFLKQGWYAHFWNNKMIIILFKSKKFEFDINDKNKWNPAVEYGLSIGIPRQQLDFQLEF